MAVISIFSGSYCQATEVAKKTAEKLGYKVIADELIAKTSEKYNIPAEKILKVLTGPTPFFNKLTREKERYTAYVKEVLAETLQSNDLVYHGLATLLIPSGISHVLKVGIYADHQYRMSLAARTDKISDKEADNRVRKDDNKKFQWSQYLTKLSPWDEELYDVSIPMHEYSVDEAVAMIVENSQKPAVATTSQSTKAMADFLLAAQVNVAMVEKNQEAEVVCDSGTATIIINKFVKRLEHKKGELQKIAETVPGVTEVNLKVGPKYNMPAIYPPEDFEIPQKVLLVDDEKEFVHALSERLQSRNLESAVVYDGEEALSFAEGDEPEVMVLDLKMPGIDGIEVLRRVKQNHPDTEVIILTGHGSEKEERLAAELGAFAYLQKPVDVDKLSQTMKAAYKKIRESKGSENNSEREDE
jgi:two-component system, OmpR family, response regulator CpxR